MIPQDSLKSAITLNHVLLLIGALFTASGMFYNVKAHAERNEQGYKAGDARIQETCEARLDSINNNIKDIKESLLRVSERLDQGR